MSNLVRSLRQERDEKSQAMLDILRALVAFGGSLWRSELGSCIAQLHVEGLGYELSSRLLDAALKELEKKGAVSTVKAKRATETGAVDDELVRLRDESVRVELAADPVLAKYFDYFRGELEKALRG
uniref:Uncharacterized protein n=1 Tax=Thermofilum pendens TaxID=2269 RepID=A0A7C3WJL2_THEPE